MTTRDDGAVAGCPLPRARRVFDDGARLGWHSGAQISVVTLDGDEQHVAWGHAVPDGREMDVHMVFPLFCAARPVLAIAIAQLAFEGALGLDDPVALYIPGFERNGKALATVRHVLQHRVGFGPDPVEASVGNWSEKVAAVCGAAVDPDHVGRRVWYQPASFWYVLGEIVMRLRGSPLAEALRAHVVTPLGLHEMWMGMTPSAYAEARSRLATVADLRKDADPFLIDLGSAAVCCDYGPLSPRSSIAQLASFYRELLSADAPGRLGLDDLTFRSLRTPQAGLAPDGHFGVTTDVGLGVQVESRRHGRASTWFGAHCSHQTFGYYGAAGILGFADPEAGIALAMGFNGQGNPLRNRFRRHAVVKAIYEDIGSAATRRPRGTARRDEAK